jgi:dihydropteroate synthase
VEAIRSQTRAPISIDTYKSVVAEAAIASGADMVNDVWALRADPGMADVVARAGVPLILMHNRSNARHLSIEPGLGGHYVGVEYDDVVADVTASLEEAVQGALSAGVASDRIIVDPGLGFGKTHAQNLELLSRLDEVGPRGYPLLVGPSRKSFIGLTLDLEPQERIEGTAAAVAVAITRGADIVRVHDVLAMSRVARMTDAIVRRQRDLRHGVGGVNVP